MTAHAGRLGGEGAPNTGLQMKLLETHRVVLDLDESDHITAHERARRDAEAVVSLFTGRRGMYLLLFAIGELILPLA